MRKLLPAAFLLGVGYILANTPSVWWLVVYLIPLLVICLIIATVRMFVVSLRGKVPDDD